MAKRVLGPEHESTLAITCNLATAYRNQKQFTEAEPLAMKALETSKKVLGLKNPVTLTCMKTLASIYQDQQLEDKYEKLNEQLAESGFAQYLTSAA